MKNTDAAGQWLFEHKSQYFCCFKFSPKLVIKIFSFVMAIATYANLVVLYTFVITNLFTNGSSAQPLTNNILHEFQNFDLANQGTGGLVKDLVFLSATRKICF